MRSAAYQQIRLLGFLGLAKEIGKEETCFVVVVVVSIAISCRLWLLLLLLQLLYKQSFFPHTQCCGTISKAQRTSCRGNKIGEKVILMGFSAGGSFALMAAKDQKMLKKVSHLVLIAPWTPKLSLPYFIAATGLFFKSKKRN